MLSATNVFCRVPWRLGLLSLVFVLLFVRLGVWQLHRADEKSGLLERYAVARSLPPLAAHQLRDPAQLVRGRQVRLHGRFLEARSVLLDNRILDGRVGVELLQVFVDDDAGHVLVNRGFVPIGPTRALPVLPAVPAAPVTIMARIYVAERPTVVLREDVAPARWPWLVQAIDLQRLQEHMDVPLLPVRLRLTASSPGALPRNWVPVTLRPQTHVGYAVQWFALAAAVCVLWLSLAWRAMTRASARNRHDHDGGKNGGKDGQ